jgi:hypothetical protein
MAAAGLSNSARITAGAFGASIAVMLRKNRAALRYAQLAEAINRGIDVQAATEFFWAPGALFLVLSALALLAKPAHPASGTSPVSGYGISCSCRDWSDEFAEVTDEILIY